MKRRSAPRTKGLQGCEVPAFAGTTKGYRATRFPPARERRGPSRERRGPTRERRTTSMACGRRSSGVVDSVHELQSPPSPPPVCLLLASRPGGALYLGVTSNLVRRVWQHKSRMAEGHTPSIQHLLARVVRTTRNHGEAPSAGRRQSRSESGLEGAPDRGAQSLLARPLRRHLLIPLANPRRSRVWAAQRGA